VQALIEADRQGGILDRGDGTLVTALRGLCPRKRGYGRATCHAAGDQL
jgi:hypothetical protein